MEGRGRKCASGVMERNLVLYLDKQEGGGDRLAGQEAS